MGGRCVCKRKGSRRPSTIRLWKRRSWAQMIFCMLHLYRPFYHVALRRPSTALLLTTRLEKRRLRTVWLQCSGCVRAWLGKRPCAVLVIMSRFSATWRGDRQQPAAQDSVWGLTAADRWQGFFPFVVGCTELSAFTSVSTCSGWIRWLWPGHPSDVHS